MRASRKEIIRIWGKRVGLFAIVALGGAQFFPGARTNPAVNPTHTIFTSMPVPPPVVEILNRACEDCHSNQTVWPWYTRVAPVSWLTIRDVSEGRRELNFSEWGQYAPRRQERKLKEICEQVDKGSMPMPAYTWIHRTSKLSETDRKALCEWSKAAQKGVSGT